MKIAILAKLFAPISKVSTGGTETFVYNLARELKQRHHDVTVFATGDSKIEEVNLVPVIKESYWTKYNKNLKLTSDMIFSRKLMSDEILGYVKTLFYLKKNQNKFDIIHNNSFNYLPLSLNNLFVNIPFLTTLHVPEKSSETVRFLNELENNFANNYYIAISKNQAENIKGIKVFNINFNGIDNKRFIFGSGHDGYLAWAGRIVPEKGLEQALDIVFETNLPLKIAGPIADQSYYLNIVKPKIDKNNNAQYLGELLGQNLVNFYQNAKVLLFPINWEEPFGLVMTEALACGTPVVAFRRGSVPEIIKDGETGFICPAGDIDCMVKKVKEIYAMPIEKYQAMRRACRKHVEENFTVEKMVNGYEKVYERVIEDWKKRHAK